MYLLRSSAQGLSTAEAQLAQHLAEQMSITTGQAPSRAERRSWELSIPRLRTDLVDAGLGKVEMLIEYQLPLTSKRADVVLAGEHPTTGHPSYVVVELKQWSEAARFEDSDVLVEIDGYGRHPVLHPLEQVRGYCDYLEDFVVTLSRDEHDLVGAAYLHNATNLGIADLRDMRSPDTARPARLFSGQDRGAFLDFLRTRFAPGVSGAPYADHLLGSKVAPSKQLLALAADEVQRREQFVLLDEQRDAYELVLHAVEKARRSTTKTAIVVSGGPGSGKSVIALSLVGELSRQGRTVMHATGSQSFTRTLRKVAGARAPRVQKMFGYFNGFMAAEPNDLDCLILDEAHRIRKSSESRFTRKDLRTGRPQVDELLSAAKVPVFLLDQHQVVRPGEMGTVEAISEYAEGEGMQVHRVDLDDQFRCGGSALYVEWVERLLGLAPGGPITWGGDESFELHVVDSPEELEHVLNRRQEDGYSARMAAGFCWPWSDPLRGGTLVPDVQIDAWSRPWNLKGDRSVGGAPAAALWATDPAGFGQVGCIYTAQGFEYDHAGIIFGPDLVWRDGRWRAVREGSRDPALRSRTAVTDRDFDRLVRNVYKVLLTRGMRSAWVYSTDPQTRDFLRTLVRR